MEIDENQDPLSYLDNLSQLVFMVGHVAIKQLAHVKIIEAEWKKHKAETESKGVPRDDELEQVSGTTEEEFGEMIAEISENELLYGPDSLLTLFAPMIVNICANNKTYKVSSLEFLL